ncbi:MAG: hypothetical protein C0592_10905 [Marinilabiliales bacterium]|nr:MAG: hypothetical protein C0592_10905 [Marinilabiliales bacterium]
MYPEDLEKLIQLALADGIITESERTVLHKKAASHNIDPDELNMVLDARLYERKKEMEEEKGDDEPKKGEAEDNKCPSCGAHVKSYTMTCPYCQYDMGGDEKEASESIQELFRLLNEAEGENKGDPSIGKAIGGMFAKALGQDKTLQKKMTIIRNFPIPSNRKDIIEFLSMAIPLAKQKGNFLTKNSDENLPHNELVPTWKSKCEQIIIKAKVLLKGDSQTMNEVKRYAAEIGIKNI